MTSMLYTGSVMNNKPNIPEETGLVTLNFRKFSFRTDMKVNGWLFVAALTNFASIMLLHSNTPRIFHLQEKDWPVLIQAIIELLPMFISLLWIRDVARWIRGMDELHRRIMLEACLFAVIGTLFFVTTWNHLDKTGILKAIFQPPFPPLHRWDYRQLAYLDFSQFTLIAGLLLSFYFLGFFIFDRRYK